MAWVAGFAGLVAVAVSMGPVSPRARVVTADLLQFGAALAAAALCTYEARRRTGRPRLGWGLLAAACASWTVGQTVWMWHELVRRQPVPFPGIADIGYLAMYPFAIAGLLALSRLRSAGKVHWALVLDGVLSVLAVHVLAWPILVHPRFHDLSPALGGYVTIAYPLADILLLGLAGGIVLRGQRAWRSDLGLLYLGFLAILAADLSWTSDVFAGSYVTGQAADAGWTLGFLLIGAASLAPALPEHRPAIGYSTRVGRIMPVAATAVGALALILDEAVGTHRDASWLLALVLLFLAAFLRQVLHEREHRWLTREGEEARQRYREVVDSVQDGIVQTTPDGRILLANPAFARLVGYGNPQALLAAAPNMRTLYQVPQQRDDLIHQLQQSGQVADFLLEMRRRDGTTAWVSATLRGQLDSSGELARIDGVMRDVTRERQLAQDLRRTQRTLRVISLCNQALVRAKDEASLMREVCDLLVGPGGYRMAWIGLAEDGPGKPVRPAASGGFDAGYIQNLRVSWDADDPRGQGPTGRAIRSGTPQVASDILHDPNMAPWRADAIARNYAASCAMPMLFPGSQRAALMVYASESDAFGSDEVALLAELAGDVAFGVSSLRTAKAKAERDADYRSLFEHMAEGVAHCRMVRERGVASDWTYLHVNPAFARLTGLNDVEGKRATDILPGIREENPELFALYDRVARGGPPERIETEVPALGRWLAISVYSPAPDEFVAVLDNITERRRAEQEKAALHARYSSIVENALEGIFRTGLDGEVMYANPALARLLGYTGPADLKASLRNARQLYVDPADRETLLRQVRDGRNEPFELHWRRKDGALVPVAIRAQVVETPDGPQLQGFIQDLTRRQQAETALRESERLLREAQEVAHLGSWEHDHRSGAFKLSDEAYRILEVPAGTAMRGDELTRLVHPLDLSRTQRAFVDAVSRGTPLFLEYRLRMADGRVKHVLAKGRTELSPGGQPVRSVGTVLDITELKQVQDRLRESEDTNRRLVEESPLAIVRVAPDGRFLEANPAAVRIYGVPDRASLLAANVKDFYVRPQERDGRLKEAASANGQAMRETQLRRPDGTLFWVRSTSRAVRDVGGAIRYYEGVIEDVTEQKAAGEAMEALAAKDREVKRLEELNKMRMEFINTAAHDLKTPLTPLKLQMATLKVQGKVDAQQRAAFDLMERNLNRFQALIEDMLDAARLQAGRLKLKRVAVDLGPLVQESVASFQEQARQAGLQVAVAGPPGVLVDADPTKCMQVLMNLVSNAVKYTPRGGTVDVRMEEAQGQALLHVRDSGLGMTADQLARLFQPFVRLHEGIPGTAKGTGLGLYISKGIVEQHGGRLWAESEGPGHGSTFHLAWPLAKTVNAAQAQQRPEAT